jgi:hypothetical protein
VVDISYFIVPTDNFSPEAPRDTLFYLLHKDQDYTELSVVLTQHTNDDKLSDKFKSTKRLVDICPSPSESNKKLIFTTNIHRSGEWVIITGRFGSIRHQVNAKHTNQRTHQKRGTLEECCHQATDISEE